MGGHAASMRVRSPSYMLGKVLNSISNQTTAFGVGQSVPTTRTPNCQSVFFHSQHQRCLCSTDLDRGVGGFIAQLNRNRSFQCLNLTIHMSSAPIVVDDNSLRWVNMDYWR